MTKILNLARNSKLQDNEYLAEQLARIQALEAEAQILDRGAISVHKYLGEIKDSIIDRLRHKRHAAINAPTGSGKTTLVKDIAEAAKNVKYGNLKRVIYTAPLKTIVEQQAAFSEAIAIMGGASELDIVRAQDFPLILCTYDSVHKLEYLFHNSILVIDEVHLLETHYDFRQPAIERVWEAQRRCGKSISISADVPPALEYCGYDILNIETIEHTKYPTYINLYHTGSYYDIIRYHIPRKAEGLTIVEMDNLELLQSYAEDIEKAGLTYTIISSKDAKYKEDNPHYQSIIEHGKPAHDLDFILCTSVLEVGVSILCQVAEFIVQNERDHRRIKQLIARARMNGEINKSVKVHIYQSRENIDAAMKTQGAILRDYNGNTFNFKFCTQRAELNALSAAKKLNSHLSEDVAEAEKLHHKYQDNPSFKAVRYYEEHGAYMPFAPAVMWLAYKDYLDRPFSGMVYDLRRSVKGMKIEAVNVIRLDGEGMSEAVKERAKTIKERAFSLIQQPVEYLEALYFRTKDAALKTEIQTTIGAPDKVTPEIEQYTEQNKDVLTSGKKDLPAKRLFKLYRLLKELRQFNNITLDQAAELIAAYHEGGKFKEQYNRLLAIKDAQKNAHPTGKVRHAQRLEIKKRIRKRELNGQWVKLADLNKVVMQVTGDPDPRRCAMWLKDTFFYDQKRDKIRLNDYVTAEALENEIRVLFLEKCDPDENAQNVEMQDVSQHPERMINVLNNIKQNIHPKQPPGLAASDLFDNIQSITP